LRLSLAPTLFLPEQLWETFHCFFCCYEFASSLCYWRILRRSKKQLGQFLDSVRYSEQLFVSLRLTARLNHRSTAALSFKNRQSCSILLEGISIPFAAWFVAMNATLLNGAFSIDLLQCPSACLEEQSCVCVYRSSQVATNS